MESNSLRGTARIGGTGVQMLDSFCDDARDEGRIEGAGDWMQQAMPGATFATLLDFLKGRED